MKCQILFFWKNKKNIINLSSAENAQRVVKVKGGSSVRIDFASLLKRDLVHGSKFFPFRVDLFSEGAQCAEKQTGSPLQKSSEILQCASSPINVG